MERIRIARPPSANLSSSISREEHLQINPCLSLSNPLPTISYSQSSIKSIFPFAVADLSLSLALFVSLSFDQVVFAFDGEFSRFRFLFLRWFLLLGSPPCIVPFLLLGFRRNSWLVKGPRSIWSHSSSWIRPWIYLELQQVPQHFSI
jgi:hypothetical protein